MDPRDIGQFSRPYGTPEDQGYRYHAEQRECSSSQYGYPGYYWESSNLYPGYNPPLAAEQSKPAAGEAAWNYPPPGPGALPPPPPPPGNWPVFMAPVSSVCLVTEGGAMDDHAHSKPCHFYEQKNSSVESEEKERAAPPPPPPPPPPPVSAFQQKVDNFMSQNHDLFEHLHKTLEAGLGIKDRADHCELDL